MTQIYVCVNWVFNPEHTQEWLDARQSHDWIQFWQWCYIEILVFGGYLVSAILFNFLLFFKSPVADIENPATGDSEHADILES